MRIQCAQLNLIACCKARANTACEVGLEYARLGLLWLGDGAWQHQPQITRQFHELAAELAALSGDFETMETRVNAVIQHSPVVLDRIKACSIRIQADTVRGNFASALEFSLDLLRQLGVTLPEVPAPEDLQRSMMQSEQALEGREIAELAHLPTTSDPTMLAIADISSNALSAAHFCNALFAPLLTGFIVRLSVEGGNSPLSASCYVSYGLLLCNVGQIERGLKFGHLALELAARPENRAFKPNVMVSAAACLLVRQRHLQQLLPLTREAYETALELGSLDYVGYAASCFCDIATWCAQPLAKLESEAQSYRHELQKLHRSTAARYCESYLLLSRNLQGLSPNPLVFGDNEIQETERIAFWLQARDYVGLSSFYSMKLLLCCTFGEMALARQFLVEAERYAIASASTLRETIFYFYDSLVALNAETPTPETWERIDAHLEKLRNNWARYAPMNFQHKVDLIAAEKCRVLGQKAEAIESYDRAIAGAKENEYLQDEALANELAARFYLDWGKPKIAADYLQEAYYGYAQWGAKAKTDHLEQCYPQLLAPILQGQTAMATSGTLGANSLTSGSNPSLWLDLPSVLRAAQTLSEEIHLEQLLARLMHIALTNAGAERGHLLLHQEGQWLVVARAQSQQTADLQSRPLEEEPDLPKSFIYAAARRRIPIVCDSLALEPTYARDRDVLQRQPQSALGLPLLRQGQLIGLLYLENNLTAGAFTAERQSILQLLASQAAISIDNARLYQQTQNYSQTLEVEVERQTEALNQKARDLESALKQLQQAQAQLIQTEKMSSLGQLVAGIAHEINNPVSFIKGNVGHAKRYLEDSIELLKLYRSEYPEPTDFIQDKIEEIDFDFLVGDATKILDSMKAGSDRIDQIVRSLRNFSRLDEAAVKAVDLLSGLDSTLLILGNRLQATPTQPEITIVREYQALPPVTCYPSQLNQVFLNLINNAIDAIREKAREGKNPYIRLRTESLEGERVRISIANSDSYIPEAVCQKIFEPFFTTKPIGRGTGLGLFVSYSIIEQHQGTLSVRSILGAETEFEMILPIHSLPL